MTRYFDDETLEEIGRRLAMEVDRSTSSKGNLPDRWKANWGIHLVSQGESSPEIIEGRGGYNIPITRSKQNRIASNIYGAVTNPEITCPAIDITSSGSDLEPLDLTMQTLMEDSGFFDRLKPVIQSSIITNASFMTVLPKSDDDGSVIGVICDDVSGENAFVYPSAILSLAQAKSYGYAYQEYKFDIIAKQESGEYLPGDVIGTLGATGGQGGTTFSLNDSGQTRPQVDVIDENDAPVNLIWGVTKVTEGGKKGERFCFVLAKDTCTILSIEPFGAVSSYGTKESYKTSCMVPCRFKTAEKQIWTQDSIANGMQDMQRLYSMNATLCQQGSEMAAFPVTYMTGGQMKDQFKALTPGMMISGLPPGAKMETLRFDFNAGALPMLMGKIEEIFDSETGYGRLGTGEALPSGATAHEVEALVSTMNEQKDEYLDCVAPMVEHCWTAAYEYLKIHFDSLKAHYADAILVTYEDLMSYKIKFKMAGTSATSNSGTRLQKLQMALQMTQGDPTYDSQKVKDWILGMLLDRPVQSIKRPPEVVAQHLMAMTGGIDDGGQQQQAGIGVGAANGQQPVGTDHGGSPTGPGLGGGIGVSPGHP